MAGQQTNGQPLPIMGVVTNVNYSTRQISVVVSAGQDQRLTQVGRRITVQRDVNLVDIEGPVASNTPILRDGRQARFKDLHEGDVVRATFDPLTRSFNNVHAVSRQELRKNPQQARLDLR